MARKSRERKKPKPRFASPHSVSLALSRAEGILSRSKKLGTMTSSDKGISIKPDDEPAEQAPYLKELEAIRTKEPSGE
jgi:hypothetical protein